MNNVPRFEIKDLPDFVRVMDFAKTMQQGLKV